MFSTIVLIPFICKMSKPEILRWDAALREWQNSFNKELHQYGIFVKTQVQTACIARREHLCTKRGDIMRYRLADASVAWHHSRTVRPTMTRTGRNATSSDG